MDAPRTARGPHPTRLDIQGLRAVAVGLVLVYHLVPKALPGGYIGVDMFFVISGFLITGQLIREAETSERIDLPRFWARRAKRLLPAALLVLLVTLVGVWTFAPYGARPAFLQQLAASAGYVQNWALAAQAVDYHAAEAQASPVQHYWSLSVEEQFYFVWPLIAVLAIVIALKLRRKTPAEGSGQANGRGFRRAFTALVLVIGGASLAYSIILTNADPAAAYFVTPTRAWEFAIGGLIACVPLGALRLSERARLVAAWAGIAGIAAAAAVFTDATPFPGVAALLPVVATALVILAGEPGGAWSPQRFLALRPMQWLGDISYGVYLWHFPLIILVPYALGGGLTPLGMIAVAVATLVLAQLSKTYVEDPFRTGFSREWSNRRALVVTAAGAAAMLAIPLVTVQTAERELEQERDRVASIVTDPPECLGAQALDADSDCETLPDVPPLPDPTLADKSPERCLSGRDGQKVRVCEYGADVENAERSIALVGDSHAEQWLPPLKRIAEERDWHLVVMAKASCPFTAAERDFVSMGATRGAELAEDCAAWNKAVLDELEERPEIDTLITSAKASNQVVADSVTESESGTESESRTASESDTASDSGSSSGSAVEASEDEDWQRAAVQGYEQQWDEVADSVERIIAVEDTPELPEDTIQCVTSEGGRAGRECAIPAEETLGPDPLAEAAERSDRATLVSMNDFFVVEDETPPVIGGVLVYRDSHHLSWAYADMLTEPLEEALAEVLPAE